MAARHLAGCQEVHPLICESCDLHIEEREIDVLPLAAGPPFVERRENRNRRVQAREDVGNSHADLHRFAIRLTGNAHEAAHRLHEEIVTWLVLVRTGLAEPGDRAINEPWIDCGECFVVESKLLQTADLEVLDDDIG